MRLKRQTAAETSEIKNLPHHLVGGKLDGESGFEFWAARWEETEHFFESEVGSWVEAAAGH